MREDVTIFTLPPSPVSSYEPATKPSEAAGEECGPSNVREDR